MRGIIIIIYSLMCLQISLNLASFLSENSIIMFMHVEETRKANLLMNKVDTHSIMNKTIFFFSNNFIHWTIPVAGVGVGNILNKLK